MWKFISRNPISPELKTRIDQCHENLLSRKDLGFFDLKLLESSVAQVKAAMAQHKLGGPVVVVGIGGSALGARAFCEAVFPLTWQESVLFLDNVDAHMLILKLRSFKKVEKATWLLISKSGSTIETLSTFDFCRQFLLQTTGTDIVEKSVVITEEKSSPLFDFARKNDRPCLAVPLNVGGRYSVFTPVGLLPLAIAGLSVDDIAAGVSLAARDENFVTALACEMLTSLLHNEYNFYLFCYSDRLQGFGLWLQQLWSESLAKSVTRKGQPAPVVSTLVPCRGASDQHSVLQQVMEGREKKFVCFVRDQQAESADFVIDHSVTGNEIMLGKNIGQLLAAEAQATADALSEKGIRSVSIKAEAISATSLASLMMSWMLVVGTLGEALDINAFDQPGVESGKRLARRVLGASD